MPVLPSYSNQSIDLLCNGSNCKIWETRKMFFILHSALCDPSRQLHVQSFRPCSILVLGSLYHYILPSGMQKCPTTLTYEIYITLTWNLFPQPAKIGWIIKIAKSLWCLSLHKICENTGEYGSVKTHIIAYFMQCLWKLIGYKQNSVNKLIKRKVFTLCFNHWYNVYIVRVIHIEKGMSKTCLALKWSNEFFSDEI